MERVTLAAVGGVILVSLMFVGMGERGEAPAEAPDAAPPPLAPLSPLLPRRPFTPLPRPPELPPRAAIAEPPPPGTKPPPAPVRVSKADANAAIQAQFQDKALQDSVLRCLQAVEIPKNFHGLMTLEFHFDGLGLADTSILDQASVPEGLAVCLSDALWAANWPQITDGEVDAAWPIRLSTE